MSAGFVAVVGPSGSGKDSVIECARTALEGHGGVIFPRRRITRPAGAGEDHDPVSEAEFAAAENRGDFALTWQAHGLAYGIPAAVFDAIATHHVVVANVSREVLTHLPTLFANVWVVRITVPEHIRRARILARGREDEAGAEARVSRPDPAPGYPADLEIVNDGTLEEAGTALTAFLTRVHGTQHPHA